MIIMPTGTERQDLLDLIQLTKLEVHAFVLQRDIDRLNGDSSSDSNSDHSLGSGMSTSADGMYTSSASTTGSGGSSSDSSAPSPLSLLMNELCDFWSEHLDALYQEVELKQVLNPRGPVPRAPAIGLIYAYRELSPERFKRKVRNNYLCIISVLVNILYYRFASYHQHLMRFWQPSKTIPFSKTTPTTLSSLSGCSWPSGFIVLVIMGTTLEWKKWLNGRVYLLVVLISAPSVS